MDFDDTAASGSRTPSNGKKGLRSHPASYYGLEADGHPIPANGEPPLPQSSVKTKGRLLSNQLKRLGVDSPVVRTALSKNDTAGRPVSYAGEIYKYSEINNCSPEVLEVVHYLNDKLHSWWTRNSEANSAGTRLCAHTHIIGRKVCPCLADSMTSSNQSQGPTSQNDWNHGPDFACGKCTSAHRPCIHAAVIDDNMVLVVKPFFSG